MVDQLGFSLCLVTDRSVVTGTLEEAVEECLGAGLKAVQLREKDLGPRDLLSLALKIRESTSRHGARLFVNDRADVALAVGADGVHRTGTSLPISSLRSIGPQGFLIGASVHSVADARAAEPEGADFLFFGPIYDTPSKRRYGAPQGLAVLERVASAVRLPVFAIGGVTPARVAELQRAGASGVAAIGAVLGAERPGDAVKAFLDALGRT
ncbi:MAG TPA: thiamine phosphate synthase [Methylomirabilota bacterium]